MPTATWPVTIAVTIARFIFMDNKLYDANRIYDAGTKAMTGSRFKYKTQLYEMSATSSMRAA